MSIFITVKRFKSISLLLLIGVIIFPWRLICLTHPFGHNHVRHEPDKLSPCELREHHKGTAPAFFPPMHCNNMTLERGEFQTTGQSQIKPTFHAVAMAVLFPELRKIKYPQQPYLFLSDPKCRSAPLISSQLLRAPPSC